MRTGRRRPGEEKDVGGFISEPNRGCSHAAATVSAAKEAAMSRAGGPLR